MRVTEAQKEEAIRMRAEGASLEDIGGILDLSYRQVRRILRPESEHPYIPGPKPRRTKYRKCVRCQTIAILNWEDICLACQVRAQVAAGRVLPFSTLQEYPDLKIPEVPGSTSHRFLL